MQPVDGIEFIGSGLKRPECVLAHSSGVLIVPDWTDGGGVSLVMPDGRTVRHLSQDRTVDNPLRPNGIALEDGGSILLAHLGDETGGVFRLFPDGSTETVIDALEGSPLPPSNFVIADGAGGLWLTISTRRVPRALGYRKDVDDGFIVHIAADGPARIAADGLGYTNECMVHPSGKWLYVNETFVRRLSRFELLGPASWDLAKRCVSLARGRFLTGSRLAWMAMHGSRRLCPTGWCVSAPMAVRPPGWKMLSLIILPGSSRPIRTTPWAGPIWMAQNQNGCETFPISHSVVPT
jgi:sugar lactone lactonase YvrE